LSNIGYSKIKSSILTGKLWLGINRAKQANAWRQSLVSGHSLQAQLSPQSATLPASRTAAALLPLSAWHPNNSQAAAKITAVALANKLARIAWGLMTRGGAYRERALHAA
jgi:hypothetical protein